MILANLGRSAAKAPPASLEEWGSECAGCGEAEYRVDGFCSIECRDRYELAHEILEVIGDA